MKAHKIKGFWKEVHWGGQQQLEKDSHVVTDGLWAFNGLQDAGIKHEAIVTGGQATGVSLDQYSVGQC